MRAQTFQKKNGERVRKSFEVFGEIFGNIWELWEFACTQHGINTMANGWIFGRMPEMGKTQKLAISRQEEEEEEQNCTTVMQPVEPVEESQPLGNAGARCVGKEEDGGRGESMGI